jgi:hypothetical protein
MELLIHQMKYLLALYLKVLKNDDIKQSPLQKGLPKSKIAFSY